MDNPAFSWDIMASKLNDFTIHVATENGSGSQSSNLVILRALFNMGIPVCGKNLFPSNIQGLPTWFTIRLNPKGYTALSGDIDLLVSMNRATATDDITALKAGSVVISEDAEKFAELRKDLTYYSIPFSKLTGQLTTEFRLKKLLANMVYVGVVMELLKMDRAAVVEAIESQFSKKPKVVESNMAAIDLGAKYVRENIKKIDKLETKRLNKTKGKILIDGNTASALGALNAGCTVLAWYPITPSSSLCEKLVDLFEKFRKTPDGKHKYAVIQAEDEIAAVGMAIGAGWAGARAMTSSSGPGISLMTEFTGLAYFAEIPVVIFDVQRVGPSTGLPTRTMQGDLLSVAYLSHGDTKHPFLLPGSMKECYEFSMLAFDMAEYQQSPVFVLSDLDLGMNTWMSEPFEYPKEKINRGKVLTQKDLASLKEFGRYKDMGDGVPARVLPGTKTPLAGFLTRGSGHNPMAQYSEKPEDYQYLMDRLNRKFQNAIKMIPEPIISESDNEVGLIYYGSTQECVLEAIDTLREERNIELDSLRIRGFPFHKETKEFIDNHKRVYVVDMNRDGQMKMLLCAELGVPGEKLVSILHYNGHPMNASEIVHFVVNQEKQKKRR